MRTSSKRAFGNLGLSVHVKTAGADVFRAGDTGNVLAVEENVHNQARAIVTPSLFLRFKPFVVCRQPLDISSCGVMGNGWL